ncbi:MAG: hypothetical protein JXC32_19590 [Anaerolineae bacterium]|nr:hypothetical protein [Anaerolineae bacterium]
MVAKQDPDLERRSPASVALAVILWLATSGLSVAMIPLIIDLATGVYAAFWADYGAPGQAYYSIVAIRQLMVMFLAMVAVAVTIGGAEYHARNFGTERSWRIYARTLGIEVAVVLMTWIV